MPEFRITRPKLYQGNCAGRADVSAREGHYIVAETRDGAALEAASQYPDKVFDVQDWKPFDSTVRRVTFKSGGFRWSDPNEDR